jgi:hypothetical protein
LKETDGNQTIEGDDNLLEHDTAYTKRLVALQM